MRLVGRVTRLVDIYFGSVKQLVRCGFNVEFLLICREFGIENLWTCWYLVFARHVCRDLLEQIFMIARCTWFSRNATRHGSPRQTAAAIVQKARAMLDGFKIVNRSIQQPRGNLQEFWTLPPDHGHSYKVNVDAVFVHIQQASVGEGKMTAAMSKMIHQPLRPLEIEAKAMEEGISFAWDVGIRGVVLECDSKIVSDALMGSCVPPVSISNILEGIKKKLLAFRSAQVSHVKQQGNKPANIFAKYVKEVLTI